MSTYHQGQRRQSPSLTMVHVTDRDCDKTTPSRQTEQREKPCLTWLNLVLGALIPLAIGIGTVVITVQQQQNEDRRFQQTQEIEDRRFQQAQANEDRRFQQTQDNEDRRRNQDQYIANWTREQDQRQADNLHYQNIYSHYIIDISNSIFKQQNQTTTFVDNHTRLDYISCQTLTVLADLDCERKTWLFNFLHENQLLPSLLQSTSMKLQGANLSCITVKSTKSKRFEFKGLALPSVDLNNASFIECHFLDGSNFSDSSMEHINLVQSRFDCVNGATQFERAMLSHANFYGALLCNVSFNGADLSYANFTAVGFRGRIDLTGTDLSFTTFKNAVAYTPFSMIITNVNMIGASILEDEWFNAAMYRNEIEMMNVILPNGTWLWNETINWIRDGNAEKGCKSLYTPDWYIIDSWSGSTYPTLSAIHLNKSLNSLLESCCFNFTSTTTAKSIFMGQKIDFHGISTFIQSSEAEYHLSFNTKCQGGFIQINLHFVRSTTMAHLPAVFLINGTDQLDWQKKTISEKIPVDTQSVFVEIGQRDHTGLCYIDNIELYVRRRRKSKK